MAQKTTKYNRSGATALPNDKPVVYKIRTESGKVNYIGSAKRGRVQERIQEHLAAGKIPGAKVQIQQKSTIKEARETESRAIARTQPKYNKRS